MDFYYLYYAVDGDDIGKKLELLLLNNDIESVAIFSKKVTDQISVIRHFFLENDAEVIFSTGDGVLAFSDRVIDVNRLIHASIGITFSIGIGSTAANALLALKKAKGLGKARVESIE